MSQEPLQRPQRARAAQGRAWTLPATNAKLKELAEEMGINTAKLKTKAQLIAAITDVPLEDAIFGEEDGDDDEGSPSGLGAEEPVE